MSEIEVTQFSVWLAYNTFYQASLIDCASAIVGNDVYFANLTPKPGSVRAINCQSGSVKAFNNNIRVRADNNPPCTSTYGFFREDCSVEVNNNSVSMSTWAASYNPSITTRGIYAGGASTFSSSGNVVFCTAENALNSINSVGLDISAPTAVVAHSCILAPNGNVYGANPVKCIFTDPMFMGAWADTTLSFSSPCINAAPPEPFFNDRDGTRNDMGFTGGPLYQADGMTTDRPLLFYLTRRSRNQEIVVKAMV